MPIASGSSSATSLNAPSLLGSLSCEPCREGICTGAPSFELEACPDAWTARVGALDSSSLATACGVDGLKERSGIGVEALVESELIFETGKEHEEEASAAVLVFDPTVTFEDVVEGERVAEVHDLVHRTVGRADGALEFLGADVDATFAGSSALASALRLDDAADGGMAVSDR